MREPPSIPEEHLRACLREHYGLSAVTLEFLPVGFDSRAGVYRVVNEQRKSFLLKATSGPLYEPGCLVPRYLADQGIAAAVAPLPNTQGGLWSRAGDSGDWTVTVYPFIEGETGWDPAMTDAQWEAVGTTLRRIHQVTLPPGGFPSIRHETFDPTQYGRWVRTFDAQHAPARGGSRLEQTLRARWMEHRTTIHEVLTMLESLAGVLRGRSGPYVLCHADLHPANVIRDHANCVFVIDWGDAMLALKERDFLFVGEPPADDSESGGAPPFFRGYGQVEIDWVALTYYRCERVVQDLIECAQCVCFRDDLGEESKADELRLFGDIFAAGDEVDAVWATAAHLPPDLRFRTGAAS